MKLVALSLIPLLLTPLQQARVELNKTIEVSYWKTVKASTYGVGDGLVGHIMADGSVLTLDEPTIAVYPPYARAMGIPLGKTIEISYQGETIMATRTDSGPYIPGRLFDLGPATAKALGFSGVGMIRWRHL